MERFYLRVLLCHHKGPQSFEHLRTVDGATYETYRQAALRLGFLKDDAEWISCMGEVAAFRMPYQLCQLFTTILVYSQVTEVRQLWERFYDDLSQSFAHRYRALLGQEKEDIIKFKTLKSLNDLLQISGYAVVDFDLPQLPIVDQEDQMNEGQRAIFDDIIQAANDPDQDNKLFFIDGSRGTGKSTLLRHILAKIVPLVVRGTPAEIIDACLKSLTLWEHFKQLHLTENMRVRSAENNSTVAELGAFSEFLLQVGEGRHEVNRSIGRDFVKIPQDILIDNNDDDREESEDEEIRPGIVPRGLKKIIDVMYADINDPDIATDDYFVYRTILTTTNTVVHRINEAVSKRLSETPAFPILSTPETVSSCPSICHDTINKAQGQTVQNLGLYLATPGFSHGQLYVALSRVNSKSKLKALIEYPELEESDGVCTDTIVYRQIFDTN
ncbi:unnamed protein product [Phytophthora fragariaefolia]|uniref:ATP-dependent DNA helicase n=1 Tax=Phytophthora fragariaefolia TaxID=1490495 RepID=A0A9W6XZ94_9STRA|nr:unnamed protein product [Phytophthora fragariaefolia]